MLKSYPEPYRTCIVIKDTNVEDHPDYIFFNPLVAVQLYKADHNYYLEFTRYDKQPDISDEQWLAVTKLIRKQAAFEFKIDTLTERFSESFDQSESYYTLLKAYEAGMKEYRPQAI